MKPAHRQQNPLAYTTAGTEFLLVMVAVGLGGYFLGRWAGWPVLGAVVGGVLGFAAGLWRLVRTALAWQRRFEADQRRNRPGPGGL